MKSVPTPAESTFIVVSLSDALVFLRRGLLPAIFLAALLGSGTWFITGARAEKFTVQALLLYVRPEPGSVLLGTLPPPALDPAIYSLALHQGPGLEWLLQDPDVAAHWTRRQLGAAIRVLSEETVQSTVIRVETTGSDPVAITDLANKAAAALIRWDVHRSADQLDEWVSSLSLTLEQLEEELLHSEAGSLRQTILQDRFGTKLIERLDVASRLPASQLSFLRQARVPDEPDSSHRASSSAIAGILAVIVVYLLQLFQPAVWLTIAGWQSWLLVALHLRHTAQPDHTP